jgi:hypothetical protein
MTREAFLTEMEAGLARLREQLGEVASGDGFDTQSTMVAAWLKEGQRLYDRIKG